MIHTHGVDWTTGHLPGQVCGVPGHLQNMLSPDPAVRTEAFAEFCAEAHDQGAVDPCTALSLPFLFDMADDRATPDRAGIVELLLSIGREALGRDPEGIYFTVFCRGSPGFQDFVGGFGAVRQPVRVRGGRSG
ncbi:hypothetical protein [Actinacidiphila glaucinigra]|uniref:hypothetical protein n=1 Tax=Actinacidiphila glaucinigra TaxID=235986 RepID=UPI0035D7AEE5